MRRHLQNLGALCLYAVGLLQSYVLWHTYNQHGWLEYMLFTTIAIGIIYILYSWIKGE